VPRVEFECCRVERDDDLMAARPNRAALRLLSGPAARAGCQLVRLRGMGNQPSTRRSESVHVPRSRHVVQLASWSEAETARANEQLVVQGGDLSEGIPLIRNLSKKLPTSREQDVLRVMVLTGVLSPPRLESWPSHCQSWPSQWRLHLK
jgi:hypothetical protein